jgi:hypothetical protein
MISLAAASADSSKIAGIAFSIRAVRIPDCFAPAK